jgi:hypothetical protein
MSNEPSGVDVADTVSALLYGVAGWLLIGLGTLALLGAIGGLVTTAGTAEMVVPLLLLGFAFAFLAVGTAVNPRFRRRLARRREVSRFGRAKSVDDRVLQSAEGRRESCTSCGDTSSQGLLRRYQDEFLVGGVPVWTIAEDQNFYCPACAVADVSTSDVVESDDSESGEPVIATDR